MEFCVFITNITTKNVVYLCFQLLSVILEKKKKTIKICIIIVNACVDWQNEMNEWMNEWINHNHWQENKTHFNTYLSQINQMKRYETK